MMNQISSICSQQIVKELGKAIQEFSNTKANMDSDVIMLPEKIGNMSDLLSSVPYLTEILFQQVSVWLEEVKSQQLLMLQILIQISILNDTMTNISQEYNEVLAQANNMQQKTAKSSCGLRYLIRCLSVRAFSCCIQCFNAEPIFL